MEDQNSTPMPNPTAAPMPEMPSQSMSNPVAEPMPAPVTEQAAVQAVEQVVEQAVQQAPMIDPAAFAMPEMTPEAAPAAVITPDPMPAMTQEPAADMQPIPTEVASQPQAMPMMAGSLPDELRGWNWGGFLLAPFWAIAHGQFIGVLAFLPLFNIIFAFYFGAKGNELAWAQHPSDPESFVKKQKQWASIGWITTILVTVLFIAYTVLAFGALTADI
jgi:hypothetical protein